MTTLVDFEPLVDSTTDLFIDQMRKLFVDTKVTCPLGDWLQMYAFDVMHVSLQSPSMALNVLILFLEVNSPSASVWAS
jgi:hypothetical protein